MNFQKVRDITFEEYDFTKSKTKNMASLIAIRRMIKATVDMSLAKIAEFSLVRFHCI